MMMNFKRGEVLFASDLNMIAEAVARLLRLSSGSGELLVSQTGGGTSITFSAPWEWIRLVDQGDPNDDGHTPYSWESVDPDGTGGWLSSPGNTGDMDGNPAFEVNDQDMGVDPGDDTTHVVVRAWRGSSGEWLFDSGSGGDTGTVTATNCVRYLDDVTAACVSGETKLTKVYKYQLLVSGNGPFLSGTCSG